MDFIELSNRILWIDGDSTITNINLLYNKLLNQENISHFFIQEITPEIKIYNQFNLNNQLMVKKTINELNLDWNIPEKYKILSIRKYILEQLENEVTNNKFSENDIDVRILRVEQELKLWESNKLIELLKTLIYIVDTFKENNIIWGTGRGNSCCCYILYLIGLHDVDSIHYNLDIKEFFRN